MRRRLGKLREPALNGRQATERRFARAASGRGTRSQAIATRL